MARHAGRKCRRVQEVDESDDQADEPQQLHWFSAPVPSAQAQSTTATPPIQIHAGVYGMQGFLNAQQYEGDATAEQVIANMQDLPPPTCGKVNISFQLYVIIVLIVMVQSQNDYMRDWISRFTTR